MPEPEQILQVSETNRLEAFSDGVFAIAITLLILEIQVPTDLKQGVTLRHELIALWPSYLAFLTSFITIGVMWINHHRLFTLIQHSDSLLMILNMLLLLGITFIPFPTAVLAEHLQGGNQYAAAKFYAGAFFFIALVFNGLWRYATRRDRLLSEDTDREAVDAITRQYAFGPVFYLLLFAVAHFNAVASLTGSLLLAIFFALPPKKVVSFQKKVNEQFPGS